MKIDESAIISYILKLSKYDQAYFAHSDLSEVSSDIYRILKALPGVDQQKLKEKKKKKLIKFFQQACLNELLD